MKLLFIAVVILWSYDPRQCRNIVMTTIIVIIIIIIFIFLDPRKNEGKKKKLEIENAGMTTAPGGRPTQSRHVTKQN